MRLLPAGDRGVLVECHDLAEAMAVYAGLSASVPEGVIDLVPAARTVLVIVDSRRLSVSAARSWAGGTADAVAQAAAAVGTTPLDTTTPDTVTIRVRYDGPDLDDVARLTGVSPQAVIDRHTATTWVSAFIGFSPGFAYLVVEGRASEPPIPRRPTSRPAVPPGSVGLAGEFSGVYPRASPGGWQLIGATDATLWDVDRDPPALLPPGTRVRFEAIR